MQVRVLLHLFVLFKNKHAYFDINIVHGLGLGDIGGSSMSPLPPPLLARQRTFDASLTLGSTGTSAADPQVRAFMCDLSCLAFKLVSVLLCACNIL